MTNTYGNPRSSYLDFSQKQWSQLSDNFVFDFTEEDITPLLGFGEKLEVNELNDFYGPIARLIRLRYEAHLSTNNVTHRFLRRKPKKIPFIIGITGSVSVGKSTFSRILLQVLKLYLKDLNITLMNTDGFIYPLQYLKDHNLLSRKGFPESYDTPKLLKFLNRVRSGKVAHAPIYDHITYDILPDRELEVDSPDILIVEGLNILQSKGKRYTADNDQSQDNIHMLVSDFIDFSIYIDAKLDDLKDWYINRFIKFRESSFKKDNSYFKSYAELDDQQAREKASQIWETINKVNLLENILPTRERADLIIDKGADHKLRRVRLRN